MTNEDFFAEPYIPARLICGNHRDFAPPSGSGTQRRACAAIPNLNSPRKSATLRTRCMVKEDLVIEGEAVVLVPTRA